METEHEDAYGGGPKDPSVSVRDDASWLEPLARQLSEFVVSQGGDIALEAAAEIDLRSEDGRAKLITGLIEQIAPQGVSVNVWRRWLNGGETPFTQRGLSKPVKPAHGSGKEVSRGPASLRPFQLRVAKAKEELAQAKEELAYQEARDKSLLHWMVRDNLLKAMLPVFAMGPAWTVMRILSGHVSDELAARETSMFQGPTKEKAFAKLRERRKAESKLALETLDLWSGDIDFEESMRMAIEEVVQHYAERRMDRIASGRRMRSSNDMMTKVHPAALQDFDDILQGYDEVIDLS